MPDNTEGKFSGKIHRAAVGLVNRLLILFDIDIPRISSLSELPLSFYPEAFQKIFHIAIPDMIDSPRSTQDEEHNLQSMIDTLAMDILNFSLSHISGEALVAGDPQAVYNLLEIFLGYSILVTTSVDSETPHSPDYYACKICQFNVEKLHPNVEHVETRDTETILTITSRVESPASEVVEEEAGSESSSHVTEDQHWMKEDVLGSSVEDLADLATAVDEELSNFEKASIETDENYIKISESGPAENISNIPDITRTRLCDLFDLRQVVSTRDQAVNLTENQIQFLTSRLHSILIRNTKPKKLCEDAIKKQVRLLELETKDIAERKRLKAHREDLGTQMHIRSAFHTHDMRRARMKQHFEKYYLRHREQMATKDKTAEEVMIIQLLKRRLKLQKEELHDLNRDIRQYEQEQYVEERDKIASMENFYEDRLSMLRDSIKEKKTEHEIRRKAQAQKMREANVGHTKKLEREIKWMQDVILRPPFS